MIALAGRFESGRLSARDAIKVIGAGLRGAGNDIDDAYVAQMPAPDGAAGYVSIVVRLLAATFAGEEGHDLGMELDDAPREEGAPRPFRGTT